MRALKVMKRAGNAFRTKLTSEYRWADRAERTAQHRARCRTESASRSIHQATFVWRVLLRGNCSDEKPDREWCARAPSSSWVMVPDGSDRVLPPVECGRSPGCVLGGGERLTARLQQFGGCGRIRPEASGETGQQGSAQ